MKKLIFLLTGLIVASVINAQSLEDIVKKYTVANKLDQITSHQTLKVTASMSVMGMELPMEIWMKNPDKLKSVASINGQDMIQVVNGDKGYSINPMTGSSDPTPMTPEQVAQNARSNVFQNYMDKLMKDGKLKLAGEENVNEKPAYKLTADLDGGNTADIFIDKGSYFIVKQSITASGMTVDSFSSDYTETNGIMMPMKTTTNAQGMEIVINFTKVEVDIPMDDSIFAIK
jgi:outer membrane lipoprotein-sorting protein